MILIIINVKFQIAIIFVGFDYIVFIVLVHANH